MTDIAIRVQNLSKCYQIYDKPRDRLNQFVMPSIQRFFGYMPERYYREFWALKEVSLEIKKGETVGIIGRNGSGKSTLLQIICGTLAPTSGTVETSGRIAALLELGSGFNPEFTGRDNIFLNAAVLGLSAEEIDARFDEIVAFADIGQFIEQPVKTYSSGMVVRLAFAVQAVIEPDIFIVDEALAVGDEKFQRKCFSRLEILKSRGSSILFVSHSPANVIELCDRTLLLEHGTRLMYGPAAATIRAYQKLIYAPFEDQQHLIQEYCAVDRSAESTQSKSANEPDVVEQIHHLDSFDPGLKPETTAIYPVQGAEIESISICDADGNTVNVLHVGGNYQFVVSGRFMADFAGVHFGIHIRSISGLAITGQRHPEEGKYLEGILAGQKFKISFGFTMILLAGTYFVGAGIWSREDPLCLHRILDAIMFRVLPEGVSASFGYVDASTRRALLEITE